MARQVRFHEHGGPEVLRIENVNAPEPGAGELRLKVKAIGLKRAALTPPKPDALDSKQSRTAGPTR